MIIADDPKAIRAFQLLALRQALILEMKGMKHSSGRSAHGYVKKVYGFKGNRAQVLAQFTAALIKDGVLYQNDPGQS